MTEQEILDFVYPFIWKQGPAVDADGSRCMYLTPSGKKCAVGCLLKDEEYSPEFEGDSVEEIELPARLESHLEFLAEIQSGHDQLVRWGGHFREGWTEACAEIASDYNLTLPEVPS
jgi:hypothetical protein